MSVIGISGSIKYQIRRGDGKVPRWDIPMVGSSIDTCVTTILSTFPNLCPPQRYQPLVSMVPTIGLSDINHWSQRYQPLVSATPIIGLNGASHWSQPVIGLSDTSHWSQRCQPLVGLNGTNHWSHRCQPLVSPMPTIGLNGTNHWSQ